MLNKQYPWPLFYISHSIQPPCSLFPLAVTNSHPLLPTPDYWHATWTLQLMTTTTKRRTNSILTEKIYC